MGAAFAQRLSAEHQLALYDRHHECAERLAQDGHGKAYRDIAEAITNSEVIILAVKPQSLMEATIDMERLLTEKHVLFSLLAGTPLKKLRGAFSRCRLFRLMPNLAIKCGEGMIGICTEETIPEDERNFLTHLFEPLGKVMWLPETKINALTSLAGSGPAFLFAMVEAMLASGVEMGFTAQESEELVFQMMKGSLELLVNSGLKPEELKRQVATPGGTTMAGLMKFEELAVHTGIISTFIAANVRAQEMASMK